MTDMEKDYLVWLLSEMQIPNIPWNDELKFAVQMLTKMHQNKGVL